MELNLGPVLPGRNPCNGRYNKGHITHNKGRKWDEWMDSRHHSHVKSNLTNRGNPNLGGWNKKPIVTIINGRFVRYESTREAARKLGIKDRNICAVLKKKRKHCGGLRWFYFDSNDWIDLCYD